MVEITFIITDKGEKNKMYLRDHVLEPPEPKEVKIYCPECGARLYWGENAYLHKGQVIGCEHCIEAKYADEVEALQ